MNEDFESECDVDSPYYFADSEEEFKGVPVFGTDPDYWSTIAEIKKTMELVKKYEPQFILVTEYNKFLEITKNSREDQIQKISCAFTSEREIAHYARIISNNSKILLVAL